MMADKAARTQPSPDESHQAPETRAGKFLVAGSFAFAALLAVLLGTLRQNVIWGSAAPVFGILSVVAWRALSKPRAVASGLLLSLATVTALVAVPEMALRLAGFHYGSRIQFGYPDPSQYLEFEPDARLFWKLAPARPDVNEMGFLGPEIEVPVPPGRRRVVFLGDSCTQMGHPARVSELLNSIARDSIECVNLAMSGYSSYQGRVLTDIIASKLGAEVAVICYGWNDHWLAFGAIDAEKRLNIPLERVYRASRLLQLVRRATVGIAGQRVKPSARPRVPIDQYRDNLERMIAAMRASGTAVLLVTTPSAHSFRGVPAYLVEKHLAADAQSALRLHSEYNDVVRQVAREEGVWELDLEAMLGTTAADRCFHEDGIHFTPRGREEVASRIAALLAERWLGGGAPRTPAAGADLRPGR